MTHLHRGDADLHDENGEHRSTPPTADGHQLELYEARIRRHLADHRIIQSPPGSEEWQAENLAMWAEREARIGSNDPADDDTTGGRLES